MTRARTAAVAAAVLLTGLFAAPPASAAGPARLVDPAGADVVAGEYVVSLRPGVDAAAAATRARGAARDVRRVYPAVGAYRAALDAAQLAQVRRDPAVEFVEPVQRMAPLPAPAPARRADAHWGLDRIDQRDLPLDKSFTPAGTGEGVRVYVIDSGIHRGHSEFAGATIEAGTTVIQDGKGTADCYGHGTAVTSLIAGRTLGVARGVTIVPVRYYDCQGKDTEAGFLEALEWVLANARKPAIVNMSWGGPGAYEAPEKALRKMMAEGIVLVGAAGNSFGDACRQFPQRITDILTVAGSTAADAQAWFSDTGRCTDLYAPAEALPVADFRADAGTKTQSGTSLACPITVGVVAQFLQGRPAATQAEVEREIVGRASKDKIKKPSPHTPNLLLYAGAA